MLHLLISQTSLLSFHLYFASAAFGSPESHFFPTWSSQVPPFERYLLLSFLYERIHFGFVRDFFKLNFIDFPVFNISDIFINIGVFVILILGLLTIIIEASGISTGEQVSFLILSCSLFWMLSYIVSHINVIILRNKMKNVPRTFKTPLFPFTQIFGIVVTIYMMYNISTDPIQRSNIYICIFMD